MEACDLDNSGTIDYNEFLAFSLNRKKLLSKDNLKRTFNKFDKVTIEYSFKHIIINIIIIIIFLIFL